MVLLDILPAFGRVPLGRITQVDVRAWVAELDTRELAPATVVKAYQILAKILPAAVDGGLIPSTPWRAVPLPRVEREEMRFLAPAQVAHLADVIDPVAACGDCVGPSWPAYARPG